jgi:hypothetical protein
MSDGWTVLSQGEIKDRLSSPLAINSSWLLVIWAVTERSSLVALCNFEAIIYTLKERHKLCSSLAKPPCWPSIDNLFKKLRRDPNTVIMSSPPRTADSYNAPAHPLPPV